MWIHMNIDKQIAVKKCVQSDIENMNILIAIEHLQVNQVSVLNNL